MTIHQPTATRLATTGAQTQIPQPVDDLFVSRFRRLTAREIRLLILVVNERMSYRELGEALGISRANIANAMQSTRRKLAVPGHMDLGTFIQRMPSLAAMLASEETLEAVATNREERRRRDLLRVTIGELEMVAVRARSRAAILERLPLSETDDAAERMNEAVTIRHIATIAEAGVKQALEHARSQGSSRRASERSDRAG